MKDLLSVLISNLLILLAAVALGFVFYIVLDGVRVLIFCPIGLREGANCYAPGWVSYPTWLIALVAAMMAGLSIVGAALLQPERRRLAVSSMLLLASVIAIPCTSWFVGPWV